MSKANFNAEGAAFFVFDQPVKKRFLTKLGIAYILAKFVLFVMVAAIVAPFFINSVSEFFDLDLSLTEFKMKLQSLANIFQISGLLAGLMFLPIFISIYTALLRWMVRGETGGKWFGLHFGKQELHVLLVLIAVNLLILLGALLSLIPFGVLVGVTVALWDGGSVTLPLMLSIVYGTLWVMAVIWVSVRLSPAAALTVRRNKIQIFETFKISKGYFWSLFTAFIVQYFVYIAISMVIIFIAILTTLPFLGVGLAMFGWQEPNMTNVRTYVALAAIPLLLTIVAGLGLEYLGYAMRAGIGACLIVSKNLVDAGQVQEKENHL